MREFYGVLSSEPVSGRPAVNLQCCIARCPAHVRKCTSGEIKRVDPGAVGWEAIYSAVNPTLPWVSGSF